jgi:hypothetical protein
MEGRREVEGREREDGNEARLFNSSAVLTL